MSQNIELSSKGMKVSYNRFLSDSSCGLIVILSFFFAYYFSVENYSLARYFNLNVPKEITVFICIFLFFLASPIGLSINALSAAFLGTFENRLIKYWYNNTAKFAFLVQSFKEYIFFKDAVSYFGLTEDNWTNYASKMREALSVNYDQLIEPRVFINAIGIFFRNLSLLCIIMPIFFYCIMVALLPINLFGTAVEFAVIYLVFILFAVLLIVMNSVMCFYYSALILGNCYIVCQKMKDSNPLQCDPDLAIKYLVQGKENSNNHSETA